MSKSVRNTWCKTNQRDTVFKHPLTKTYPMVTIDAQYLEWLEIVVEQVLIDRRGVDYDKQ